MRREVILTILFASVLSVLTLNAQTASFLNVPENAREVAMGGLTAVGDAADVLDDDSMAAAVSYFRWSPKGTASNDINAEIGYDFGKLAVMAEAKISGTGAYPLFDDFGAPLGEYKPGDHMVGLGASYAITPKIAVSLMAKYVGSDLAPEAKATAFCADVNLVFRHKDLSVGVLAANLGTKLNYGVSSVPLPMLLKAGVQNEFHFGEKMGLLLGADAGFVSQGNYNAVTASAGLDFKMFDMLSVMAGYHFSSNREFESSYISAGLGVDVSVISISAAYLVGPAPMSGTLCATLGVRF